MNKIPVVHNIKFENARKIVEYESKRLIETKFLEDENNKLNGRDLLSLLIKINKMLPDEEKLTVEELKSQVIIKIKTNFICQKNCYLFIFII